MTTRPVNKQMFALREAPDDLIEIAGSEYRLVRVFKHDFWAATCLYEATGRADFPSVVVKIGRDHAFWGFPLKWYGKWLQAHERDIYKTLEGIHGVPRWIACVGDTGYAIEYIDALPLDHIDKPQPAVFDELARLFEQIHQRDVAYVDANKRSNILVTADGQPFLVDYQLSIRKRPDWPWPLRNVLAALVDRIAAKDIYHLYKHKRRMTDIKLTPEQDALSRRRSALHYLHRKLSKPYRAIRRKYLARQYAKGALRSPTADLEDHHQPEKETWRRTDDEQS